MTIQRLFTRLKRLEQHAQEQEAGVLYLWKLPDESVEEAFDRYEVAPDDFPAVRVHVWPGSQAAARLATPPAPLWVSQTEPVIADLERRLHEGMKQGGPPYEDLGETRAAPRRPLWSHNSPAVGDTCLGAVV